MLSYQPPLPSLTTACLGKVDYQPSGALVCTDNGIEPVAFQVRPTDTFHDVNIHQRFHRIHLLRPLLQLPTMRLGLCRNRQIQCGLGSLCVNWSPPVVAFVFNDNRVPIPADLIVWSCTH